MLYWMPPHHRGKGGSILSRGRSLRGAKVGKEKKNHFFEVHMRTKKNIPPTTPMPPTQNGTEEILELFFLCTFIHPPSPFPPTACRTCCS